MAHKQQVLICTKIPEEVLPDDALLRRTTPPLALVQKLAEAANWFPKEDDLNTETIAALEKELKSRFGFADDEDGDIELGAGDVVIVSSPHVAWEKAKLSIYGAGAPTEYSFAVYELLPLGNLPQKDG